MKILIAYNHKNIPSCAGSTPEEIQAKLIHKTMDYAENKLKNDYLKGTYIIKDVELVPSEDHTFTAKQLSVVGEVYVK